MGEIEFYDSFEELFSLFFKICGEGAEGPFDVFKSEAFGGVVGEDA
jgi:hypothetical protein